VGEDDDDEYVPAQPSYPPSRSSDGAERQIRTDPTTALTPPSQDFLEQ